MLRVVEQTSEILKAVEEFRKLVRNSSVERGVKTWLFPEHGKYSICTFKLETSQGGLAVGLPEEPLDGRFLHLFTRAINSEPLSPQVEINIPSGTNQRVSGIYVKDGNNNFLLCTRGKFHHLKMETALSHFSNRQIEVHDSKGLSKVIVIGKLGAPGFIEDIADFVNNVVALKKEHGKKME